MKIHIVCNDYFQRPDRLPRSRKINEQNESPDSFGPDSFGPAGFVVEEYLLYLLARASEVTSRQFHAVVKARGLGVAEWRILASLGEKTRSMGDLADLTLLKQPTLSKAIDRMSQQGWVARQRPQTPDVGDGRVVMVIISQAGRQIVADLQAEALRHERAILADYSAPEAARLKDMLKELIDRSTQEQ
jgi:DNA-binding MarR family transcriptional regulator